MPRQFKLWALVLTGLVLAQTVVSLILSKPGLALAAFSDILQLVILAFGTALCVLNSLKSARRIRLFWLLTGTGVGSWLVYQSLWTFIEVIQRRDVPDPFIGDAILFLHFVPMMAALALRPDVQQEHTEFKLGSLDFTLLLLWWVYLYVFAVIPWQFVDLNAPAYDRNWNVAYLAEKLAFLIAISISWSRSSGLWKKIYAHSFGATALYSFSSYVANWALAHNRYHSGSLYDLPLVASMAWMAIPGLLAFNYPPQQVSPPKPLPRGVWTARLGMIAVLSLPIFAYVSIFDTSIQTPTRDFRLVVTLTAMMIMGALLFMKQHFLDIELIRSLRSSRQSLDDLQVLQSQLVQSEKLASLGQLVGGAAHELNNPLTAMLGYSDLLSNTPLTSEQKALSEKISQQAKRIRTLVASLLSFAKQVPIAKTNLDVNVILQAALRLCQPQLQSGNVRVTTELAELLPRVKGDSNQLLQVFSHIINNAASAMAEQKGGQLMLKTRADGSTVAVEFSDSGPGMTEPGKVFDPFYTTRPVGQGIGLGLSMCYGIVQEHGGKISCRNQDAGGATFLIELPAADMAKTAQAQAHAAK